MKCIVFKAGTGVLFEATRVTNEQAADLVARQKACYVSKAEWKAQGRKYGIPKGAKL